MYIMIGVFGALVQHTRAFILRALKIFQEKSRFEMARCCFFSKQIPIKRNNLRECLFLVLFFS